ISGKSNTVFVWMRDFTRRWSPSRPAILNVLESSSIRIPRWLRRDLQPAIPRCFNVWCSPVKTRQAWTMSDWQTSGPDGTLVTTGTYRADAAGHYTLWLYAGGKTSSSISVTIEGCSVHRD